MTSERVSFLLLLLLIVVLSWSVFLAPEAVRESITLSRVSTTRPMAEQKPADDETGQSTLVDVLVLAKEILGEMEANVVDYQATLVKRERINGTLGPESSLQVKIRNADEDRESNPGLSVYLKFLEPSAAAGREVIWHERLRDGKLVAHEGGFRGFLRVTLNPTGRLAMLGNKYPITEIGLIKLLEKLIEKGERDQHMSSAAVTIDDTQSIDGRPCRMIEVRHPKPEGEIDFHIAQIFIDLEKRIPVRYAAYMWPETEGSEPPLEEEYTYFDVELNVGLTDADFDPDNPAYDFP